MKALLFTCLFVLTSVAIPAQDNYAYVDSKVLQIPKAATYSADSIAAYIQQHFSTDKEKTRAVYTWITNNIAYSRDSAYYFRRWGSDPAEKLATILRRRKGVCENYAELFTGILNKSGVLSVMISGYTKTGGTVNKEGHGWAGVYADSAWLLCDPTWDAGRYNSYHYFLVQPSGFIDTHMPFDPMWQLLEHPVSHKAFRDGFRRTKEGEPVFQYKDSVAAYLMSDTLQQMEAASRRMNNAGLEDEDLRTWYAYNQMKINIVHQEENMQLFNDAVADLNKAKKLYNEFINYRNTRFFPERPEAEINKLFTAARKHLSDAYNKMTQVGKKAENYQYDTENLRINLDSLTVKLRQQQEFWKQYLTGDDATRKKML